MTLCKLASRAKESATCAAERSEANKSATAVLRLFVAADAKLTQGRRLEVDPPRREVLPSGGPHASGGGSGGDPGLETTREERSRARPNARRITQHDTALSARSRRRRLRTTPRSPTSSRNSWSLSVSPHQIGWCVKKQIRVSFFESAFETKFEMRLASLLVTSGTRCWTLQM
jgi:hypothetical protein